MKTRKLIVIVATFLITCLSLQPTYGNTIREPVPLEEQGLFPNSLIYAWNIEKKNYDPMRCTGTYIGNNLFLSAAHCVTDPTGNIVAKKASTETKGVSDTLSFSMYKKSVFHKNPFKPMPGYAGYKDFQNDVSLTTITEPNQIPLDASSVRLAIYTDLSQLVGKTVNTTGYSYHLPGDLTRAEGKVLRVEQDGTLTVDFYVAEQNSGSPVYYNGEIIGILTGGADIEGCLGSPICRQSTVTPFTMNIKSKLFDRNGVSVSIR